MLKPLLLLSFIDRIKGSRVIVNLPKDDTGTLLNGETLSNLLNPRLHCPTP